MHKEETRRCKRRCIKRRQRNTKREDAKRRDKKTQKETQKKKGNYVMLLLMLKLALSYLNIR